MNEVGVRLKVAASGLENIQALNKALKEAGVDTSTLDTKAGALAAELARLGAAEQGAAGQAAKLGGANRDAASSANALDAQVAALTAEIARLGAAQRTAASSGTALAGAAQQTSAAVRSQGDAAQVATGKLAGMGDTLGNLAKVGVAGILGSQTVQLLKGVTETADAFANLQSRIKLVTGEGPAFSAAMAGISEIALRTSSNLESTGTLFSRIAQAGKEIGVGQAAALELTESINQAVQLSGASAEASNAAITQLIQGLQSGTLRGDEFNSVMEQAPRLAQALAAGLGVSTGELRKLAEAGQLTAATVIRSLQSQRQTLEREFALLPETVGRAIENLNTKWKLFVGSLNSGTGATGVVAKGINGIADNLETLADIAGRAGTVLLAALAIQGVQSLRALAVQMLATGTAASVLSADISKIPKIINIAVAVTGFEIGFQIGTMLLENSSLARKLGVGLARFAQELVDGLVLVKEAVAAVFTSDTVDAALKRYEQRTAAMRKNFAELYDDAEKSPEVVRAAAAAAAAETKKLGDTAQAAGTKVAGAGTAGAAGMATIGQAANDAKGAIAGLVDAAAAAGRVLPGMGQSAEQQAASLVKLALKGREAADVFQRELPGAIDKLSGTELEKFRVAMTQALAQAKDEAIKLAAELGDVGTEGAIALGRAEQASRLTQQALVDVAAQAAQSLGVDLVGASSRVSKEFVTAETNLSILVQSLPALKTAGVDTATVVAQALAKMLDGAKNQAEIDAVTLRFKTLGAQGVITGQQMAGGFDLARDKAKALREQLEGLTPGLQSLGEAARKAGVDVDLLTTGVRKDFKEGADAVRDLVRQISASGVEASRASPLLAEALDKRLQAAQTREEVRLLELVTRELGSSGKLMGNDYAEALAKLSAKGEQLDPVLRQLKRSADDAARAATQAVAQIAAEAAAIDQHLKTYSTTGRTREQRLAGQNPVDASAQFALLQRASTGDVTAADLPLAQTVLQTLLNNSLLEKSASPGAVSLNGLASRARDYALALRAVEQATALQQTASPSSAGTTRGAPQSVGAAATASIAASQASGGRTITINIGGTSRAIQVASDADAARLEAVLRQLETAANRAGG